MAVNGTLDGVRPLQQGVGCPVHLAKVHDTGQPVALVCELGGAHTLPSGHGRVDNAAHDVHRVLNVNAASIGKGEPPVPLGRCLDGIGLEGYVRLRYAVKLILVACTYVQRTRCMQVHTHEASVPVFVHRMYMPSFWNN